MWCVTLSGARASGRPFAGMFFFNGGIGGASGHDGLDCVSFPSNLSNTPIEVLEHLFPLEFERKEIAADTGGRGKWQGGNGQTIACRVVNSTPITVSFMASRINRPAEGLAGGSPGSLGQVTVNGEAINPKFRRILQPGDRLVLTTPGGGGLGEPRDRLVAG
jgi:N-methylhydantoinase B